MSSHDVASKPRVLCIDDDPAISTCLQVRLAQYDVEVTFAYFGTQGIWLAVTEHPHVIITDLRMPHGDGSYIVECLKNRRDTCDIPVIVLTGQRDREIERKMLMLGVECFLHKPVRFERLLDALGRYVELRVAVSDWQSA